MLSLATAMSIHYPSPFTAAAARFTPCALLVFFVLKTIINGGG